MLLHLNHTKSSARLIVRLIVVWINLALKKCCLPDFILGKGLSGKEQYKFPPKEIIVAPSALTAASANINYKTYSEKSFIFSKISNLDNKILFLRLNKMKLQKV